MMTTERLKEGRLDSFGIYLKQIGRTPLLTHEQEIELGTTIAKWMAIQEAQEELEGRLGRPATEAEVSLHLKIPLEELRQIIKNGLAAKQHMVQANLRLVIGVAKKYIGRGIPIPDLVAEGNLGLERAAEKFDHSKGYKFSTYAYWWIRQAITRSIANDARTVRLPIHMGEVLNKVKKQRRILSQQLGRTPTIEEIAIAIEKPVEKVREAVFYGRAIRSLDDMVGKDQDTSLADLMPSETPSPEAVVERNLLREALSKELNLLTNRERRVIELRYGLTGTSPCTLDQAAHTLGICRERVRQIQRAAMRKLQSSKTKKRLADWA